MDWLPWGWFLPERWLLFERLIRWIDLARWRMRGGLTVLTILRYLAVLKRFCDPWWRITLLIAKWWVRFAWLRSWGLRIALLVVAWWDCSWLQRASCKCAFDLRWIRINPRWCYALNPRWSHTLIRPITLFQQCAHGLLLILGSVIVNFWIEFLYEFSIFEFKVINL